MKVLNVGGGNRYLPEMFKGWEQDLLDIDLAVNPDICCSAVELREHPADAYDAVYCSHNLEHVYQHEVPLVLEGIYKVLKKGGFVYLVVPDVGALLRAVVNRDINDTWYMAGDARITFHDVLYGWGLQISAGNEYYAHKTGFTAASLDKAMKQFFTVVNIACDGYNLCALAVKCL